MACRFSLAPPVGGRTAREWSRAEPRVLVYGWVARKTVQFMVIISIPTGLHLFAVSRGATYDKMKEVSQVFVSMGFYLVFKISICLFT